MLNFAIGWAFLISFAASPGVKILSAFVDPVVFRTIPPYQGVLSNIFANYWIPALLIYLVLKALRVERFLRSTRGIHTLFGISNAILCVYALLRVFTATVEGGGATFALASMSFLAIVPALVGLVVATI